jgi:NAD(P)-dependent dehydrogenase (short-subunit alcohol dehydrogenase family)
MTRPSNTKTELGDLFGLQDKVVVVTGGSRGIGRAIAHACAAAGADTVIVSRKVDACKEVADEIARLRGRRSLGIKCHVGSWSDCNELADQVYAQFGKCDVLINNAGMSPLYPSLSAISEEYYDKVQSVNLKGPFRLSVLIGTRMLADETGSIINIGSVGALRPGADNLVYACAKAGLNALTVGLADALGPYVRVNTILPGSVMTDIAKAWTPERRATVGDDIPMRRPGVPSDLVGAALWLASEASAWVTGTHVRVDGGSHRQLT